MAVVTTVAVCVYVADKFIAQFLKEEGYSRIRSFLFPKSTYTHELQNILLEVIEEFNKKKPYDKSLNKIRFYEDSDVFDKLIQGVFLKKYDVSAELLDGKEHIFVPTNEEIEIFCQELSNKVNGNKKLRKIKKLFIEEEYKSEIFKISNDIDKLRTENRDIKTNIEQVLRTTTNLQTAIKGISEKLGVSISFTPQVIVDSQLNSPLVENLSLRSELVSEYLTVLDNNTYLAINGGVGMGKTQIAALLVRQSKNQVYWINLRETQGSNFFLKIIYALAAAAKVSGETYEELIEKVFSVIKSGSLIVLDDLPRFENSNEANSFFITFFNYCKKAGIKILSTSNYEISPKVKDLLKTESVKHCVIKPLSEKEVFEILLSYGCGESNAEKLKKITKSVSSGHPTIASAICRFLKNRAWKMTVDEVMKLFEGDFSSELTESTYLSIDKTIQDEETKELLYRIKVILGSFTQDEVKKIAEINPEIKSALGKFSAVVGLWIQRDSERTYQLSPLIKNLKISSLDKNLEQRINLLLAKSILEKKMLDPFDAKNAIHYFIAADDYKNAISVLITALNEGLKQPKFFYDAGFDLYWFNTPLPEEINLYLKLYVRLLQLTIAVYGRKEIKYLRDSLEEILELAAKDGINIAPAALLLSTTYMQDNFEKANAYLIRGLTELDKLGTENNIKTIELGKFSPEVMMWTSTFAIKDWGELDKWVSSIEQMLPEQMNKMLDDEIGEQASLSLFDRLYRIENSKESHVQNWNTFLQNINHVAEKVEKFGFDFLNANIVKYQILVNCEKLDAIEAAIEIGTKALLKTENVICQFLIKDSLGRHLFYRGHVQLGEKYVMDAVVIPVPDFYTDKLETYLVTSQIIGQKDEKAAHYYSEQAYKLALGNSSFGEVAQAKVVGEYAISLWLIGDIKKSLYELERGFNKLITSFNTSDDCKATIVRYGHFLKQIAYLIAQNNPEPRCQLESDYIVPNRGFFLFTNNKKVADVRFFSGSLFTGATIFLDCFLEIEDFELSKKWANHCIDLSDKWERNPFILILNNSISFLIIEGRYKEALERTREIVIKTNKLVESEEVFTDSIDNEELRKKLAEGAKPRSNKGDVDTIIIEHVFIPSIVNVLQKRIYSLPKSIEEAEILLKAIIDERETFEAKNRIDKIIEYVSSLVGGDIDYNKLINEAKNQITNSETQLAVICYYIAFFNAPPVTALQIHLNLMDRLEPGTRKLSLSEYIFVYLPFFESYWIHKFEINKNVFVDHENWNTKAIRSFREEKWYNRMGRLLTVVCMHLQYLPEGPQSKWLK